MGAAHIHTPGYISLLKTRPEVRVKYVWDHDAARAERRAAELEARAVTDAALVWADPEVQGAVVCAETNRQRDLVLAAARAGKHLFVEKPLGAQPRESQEMAEAIERARLIFTTGYFLRTEAKYRFVRDEVARGRFGTITRVRGSYSHRGALTGMFDQEWRWMADPAQAGGGAFANLGTHVVDFLLWCFGEPEAVTAQIRTVTNRYPGCDEAGEGMIRFQNGILATVAAGWAELDDPIRLLVSGTQAHALVWNNDLYYKCPAVSGADGVDPFTQLPPARKPPLHEFVDAVAGKPDAVLVPARDAAAAVRVMDAMYVAARENRWVRLDTFDTAPANLRR